MANSLAWSTLSQKQLEDYYSSPLEATSILSKLTTSPILIDLYTYILRYSASQNHSPIQTSTLFSIVQKTHEKCVQSPVLNFESDYDYFKKLMLSHSIYRPPYSVRVFTLNQVRDITEFVTRTYFRCYGMYKYVFTKRMLMDLSIGVVEESVPEVVQVFLI